MSKITPLTEFTLQNISVPAEAAFEAARKALEPFGIELKSQKLSVGTNEVDVKIIWRIAGEAAAKKNWDTYAPQLGLKAEDFGKEITVNRKRFKLIGIDPRARSNHIIMSDGKSEYKMSTSSVRELLNKK